MYKIIDRLYLGNHNDVSRILTDKIFNDFIIITVAHNSPVTGDLFFPINDNEGDYSDYEFFEKAVNNVVKGIKDLTNDILVNGICGTIRAPAVIIAALSLLENQSVNKSYKTVFDVCKYIKLNKKMFRYISKITHKRIRYNLAEKYKFIPNETEQYIIDAYKDILKRDYDVEGLENYVKQIKSNKIRKEQIHDILMNSSEYIDKFGHEAKQVFNVDDFIKFETREFYIDKNLGNK